MRASIAAAIAAAADNCRVFLVGDDARGTPELLQRHVLELQSEISEMTCAPVNIAMSSQHRLASIAEAGRLDRADS